MENEKLTTIIDGSGRQINLTSSDFNFVQKDKKIHDIKFKTKATTFFKDAMKRFVKSKSALAGGIIVGCLILGSIFIPLFTAQYDDVKSVYNVEQGGGGDSTEAFLQPKLFDAGFGIWDGTIKRTHITYDNEKEAPVNYNEGTYMNLVKYDSYDNVSSIYGVGGYVNISCSNKDGQTNGDFYSPSISLNSSKNYSLKFDLFNDENENYKFYGVKVSAIDENSNKYYLLGDENNFVDGTNPSNLSYENNDLTNLLQSKGYDFSATNKIHFNFEVLNGSEEFYSYILVKDFILKENNNVLPLSFEDGNSVFLVDRNDKTKFWGTTSSCGKSAYKVKITYCDFTYDQYFDIYGTTTKELSYLEVVALDGNGLKININSDSYKATTDQEILKNRFEIIDSSASGMFYEVIEQIGDARYNSKKARYEGYSLKVKVWKYTQLGYKSMPRFLAGTNKDSKDYLKLMFKGMRKSFLLAIGVSAVNIIIGLIWGSISGYFGGWTDIVMERITDIIGGLPTTVIITLCILYGREFNWGSAADVIALMVALFMTGWMGVAHRTRTQFYRFKGREYVLASRTLGAKDARLIFKHILPNSAGTIITGSILMIPSVIYTESSIAYLHLGLQGQVLFGVILSEANNYYTGDKSFLLFIPTFIMMLLLVSFNLFGNGLRDAFNPALKGGE